MCMRMIAYRGNYIIGIMVVLMLLLFWLESVPSAFLRDATYNVEAGFQRERSRLFVNSAYNLEYRPASEHVQAIRDLQISLPAFREEQALLWKNPDVEVQSLLHRAQPDYSFMVVTVQTILAHPTNAVSSDAFSHILSHDQSFFLPMNTLITILNQQQLKQEQFLMIMKLSIVFFCALGTLILLYFDKPLDVEKRE